MKKFMKVILTVLCAAILVGCGADKLSDKYSEDTLKKEVEGIIDSFNNEKYEEVILKGDENLQSQLTSDKLKEVWESVSPRLGEYKELSKIAFQEKDEAAIVVAIAKYEKSKVQFTMSFNEDMKLIGIYMK